ncbi:MAG: lipase secretion chaperone [Pseudomonadota bacterium]|nr:lipase secretion chaperone [Pseudomonadota bacterium]
MARATLVSSRTVAARPRWQRAAAVALAVGVLTAGLWYGRGVQSAREGATLAPRGTAPTATWFGPTPELAAPSASPSARQSPGRQALLATPGLALRLEDLIGEELGTGSFRDDPEGFKQRLFSRIAQRFPPDQVEAARALVSRYIDHRTALDRLAAAGAKTPEELSEAFEARKRLRQQHFDADEYAALFGADDRLDRYTLARMRIESDKTLSPGQKQAALDEAASIMTPEERRQRQQVQQHLTLQQQTAELNARQASDGERYAARQASFGAEAANRLAALDQQQRQWNQRIDQYALAETAVRQGQMSAPQLDALRQQLFTPQEQLRLPGALALRQSR